MDANVSIVDDGGALPRPVPPAGVRVPGGVPRRADRSAIRRNNLEVVTRHLATAVALFFASDDSLMINGADIAVDGGYTIQ
jgi:hypothetical protein